MGAVLSSPTVPTAPDTSTPAVVLHLHDHGGLGAVRMGRAVVMAALAAPDRQVVGANLDAA